MSPCLLDSPPKPKLSPVKVEVTEGSSVSLSCSAAAPCPTLPPTLTWTPRLSDSEDQLQENQDQTKSVSSLLTFTASHLHHGQKITCKARYKLQQGDTQKISEASLTLSVLYGPRNTQITVFHSGPILEGHDVTLNCSSDANPAVTRYEWLTPDRQSLGSGQSITVHSVQSNTTEQFLCEASNFLGSNTSKPLKLNMQCEYKYACAILG
ncbi:hypothetical protein AGOR_G00119530 [Albula goreensis]|uniref:Ig-like domain-containing protein n=1 Tax=Albula goreensis TaxID=1534307 RepID=A0A8T3DKH9_9TELE|nr:hypothetical protein AGOR_G00119530 [Albula goreensis]